jgi:hypothetical protein
LKPMFSDEPRIKVINDNMRHARTELSHAVRQ